MDNEFEKAADALKRFDSNQSSGWAAIRRRREGWGTAKKLLLTTLKELLASAPSNPCRKLHLTEGGPYEHFDGVQIAFGSIPTGIAKASHLGQSIGLERGPTLVFGQSESGLIGVFRYPAETTMPGERRVGVEAEFVETLAPEAIDRATIFRTAAEFFDWASGATLAGSTSAKNRPIGFLSPSSDEPG